MFTHWITLWLYSCTTDTSINISIMRQAKCVHSWQKKVKCTQNLLGSKRAVAFAVSAKEFGFFFGHPVYIWNTLHNKHRNNPGVKSMMCRVRYNPWPGHPLNTVSTCWTYLVRSCRSLSNLKTLLAGQHSMCSWLSTLRQSSHQISLSFVNYHFKGQGLTNKVSKVELWG